MSIFNSNFTNKNSFNPIQKQKQKLWDWGNLLLIRISWGKASRRELLESKPNLSPHIFFDGVFGAELIAKPWKWFEIKILFLQMLLHTSHTLTLASHHQPRASISKNYHISFSMPYFSKRKVFWKTNLFLKANFENKTKRTLRLFWITISISIAVKKNGNLEPPFFNYGVAFKKLSCPFLWLTYI